MQHPRSVEALLGQLSHPDPMVQKEIARALAWIGTDPAVEGLIAALRGRAELAELAAAALGHCAHASAVPALCTVASPRSSRPEAVRREALRSLGRLRSPQAVPVLREVLEHSTLFRRKKTRALRVAAAHALARIGGETAFAALEGHAQRGDRPVRAACSEALRQLSRS
jgi:HEAT repeat protein